MRVLVIAHGGLSVEEARAIVSTHFKVPEGTTPELACCFPSIAYSAAVKFQPDCIVIYGDGRDLAQVLQAMRMDKAMDDIPMVLVGPEAEQVAREFIAICRLFREEAEQLTLQAFSRRPN